MSLPSFLDIDEVECPGYLVVPIPYDGTSTYRKGADAGPRAILTASAQVELYDIETDSEAYRAGIKVHQIDLDDRSPESMAASVRNAYETIFDGSAFPVALGGEHSVSAGIIEAAAKRYPGLTVVQFDAHADLREQYHGSRYNHACVMARARDVCSIFQIGIRSMDRSETAGWSRERVILAEEIANGTGWISRLEGAISGPVYLTIDLDVLDPSLMGATGTPEPGGLGWYDLIAGVRFLFTHTKVIGADVVELCPNGDHGPEFTAARLVYKIMTYHRLSGGLYGQA